MKGYNWQCMHSMNARLQRNYIKLYKKNEPCSLWKKRSLWSNKESLAFCLVPLYYPRLHHWIYYKSCTENEFTLIHFRILGILKQLCVYAFLICIKKLFNQVFISAWEISSCLKHSKRINLLFRKFIKR